jgi:arabinogalactan oligomer/maltooligosaccharide transport system substrate-binding protein
MLKLLSVIGVMALLLAACGGGGSTAQPTAATGGGAAATSAPAAEPTAAPAAEATAAPAAEPTAAPAAGGAMETPKVTGDVTLWHAYGAGGSEEATINKLIEQAKADNPEANITVLAVPFDQLFNKFETEAAAGGGPDMFVAPNDSLGKEVRAELLADLTTQLQGKLGDDLQVAVDGCTIDGKLYCVPESLKAVALFYNKDKVQTPPKTTDELMEAVKGGMKLGINQSAYHNYGFFGAFGGKLLDDTGKCVADQGGFADAMQYLVDLKAAGAQFFTDEGKMKNLFQTGELDAQINGPWNTADFQKSLGDKLAVAPMPAGPSGPATPLTGTDGFYVNVNSQNIDGTVALALYLTSPASMKVYVDEAGHIPANKTVEITDPLTKGFAEASATGFPRPQVAELDNFWTPFGDMVTKVMEGQVPPAQGVQEACTAMNTANNK